MFTHKLFLMILATGLLAPAFCRAADSAGKLKVVEKVSSRRTTNGELPFVWNEGRPFSISLNKQLTNSADIKARLETALAEKQLLSKIVFHWIAHDKALTDVEVTLGGLIPVEIAQCVLLALQQSGTRFALTIQDKETGVPVTQRATIGSAVKSKNQPLTPEKLRALLKPGLTQQDFRFQLLGALGLMQSSAHAKVMAEAANDKSVPKGMALIPAGPFQMGNAFPIGEVDSKPPPGFVEIGSNRDQLQATSREHPVHTVQVSAFYMDRFELTMALWDDVKVWGQQHGYSMRLPFFPTQGKGSNHPVVNVEWCDALKWCNARSEMAGLTPVYYTDATQKTVYRTNQLNLSNAAVKWSANGYRLPTEAEWEKAARGGLTGKRFPLTDNMSHSAANYTANPGSVPYDVSPTRGSHPTWRLGEKPFTSLVGSFPPNGYGLYDMAGNLEEWCWDRFDANWYRNAACTQADTPGPDTGIMRVRRGGSFLSHAGLLRVASRRGEFPSTSTGDTGFRCVRRP